MGDGSSVRTLGYEGSGGQIGVADPESSLAIAFTESGYYDTE